MTAQPPLRVVVIPSGRFDQNCYLVAALGCEEAAIVDPGEDAERCLRRAAEEGLSIRAIWLTHGHLDHLLGVRTVHAATAAPIYLHPADRPFYDRIEQQAEFFGLKLPPPPPPPTHELRHGQVLTVGEARLTVLHTPGHSPGSVCFRGPGLVLVGDVLLRGTLGRADLPGGSHARLERSVREELLVLPDETLVYCGHGPMTTIQAERQGNPTLRIAGQPPA